MRLRQLASDSAIYGLSAVVSRFLSFFMFPINTRVFNPAEYGLINLVSTAQAMVGSVLILALDNSAHRWFYDTDDQQDQKRTFGAWIWCQLALSTAAFLVTWALAPQIASSIFHRPGTESIVIVAAANWPAAVLSVVLDNWYRVQRKARASATMAVATTVGSFGFTALYVLGFRWGVIGSVAVPLTVSILRSVVAIIAMRGWLKPSYFSWARLKPMLAYALPLIPAAVAYWVVNTADRWMIEGYLTTYDVGLFSAGASLATFVTLATQPFQSAFGPFAYSIHKQEGARLVYARILINYLWVACGAALGISVFGYEFLRVVSDPKYASGYIVVPYLALSTVCIGMGYIAGLGLGILKKSVPTALATIFAALVNIALCFLLVKRFGIEGAAVSTLVSQLLGPVVIFWRSQREYPIPYNFFAAAGIVAVTILFMFIGLHLRLESVALTVGLKALLCLAYLPVLALLRVVDKSEFRAVIDVVARRKQVASSGS